MSLANTILFLPTLLEESQLPHSLHHWLDQHGMQRHVCGLGPILAGTNAARMLANRPIEHAVLLGIAGAYSDALPPGGAYFFGQVACYGVGLGTGPDFQSPREAGWDFGGEDACQVLPCFVPKPWQATAQDRLLLTCCASSFNANDVLLRCQKHPQAMAEDMEAYAIATACRLAGVRFSLIRGISNRAGDRHLAQWKSRQALQSAADLLTQAFPLDPPHD